MEIHEWTLVAGKARPSRVHSWISIVGDRKSTRLNSSHGYISYAVFCLKKKKPYERAYGLSQRPAQAPPIPRPSLSPVVFDVAKDLRGTVGAAMYCVRDI